MYTYVYINRSITNHEHVYYIQYFTYIHIHRSMTCHTLHIITIAIPIGRNKIIRSIHGS